MKTIDEPRAWQHRQIRLYVAAVSRLDVAVRSERPAWEIRLWKKWAYRGLFAPFGWWRGWEIWQQFDSWTTTN